MKIEDITHAEMVTALVKPGADILHSLTPKDANLIHAIFGISGEAGELLDVVKKAVIYRKPIDVDNIIEELGDLEFYMEQLRQELNISRARCLAANKEKLAVRYENYQYSDQQAHARKDKQ